MTTIMPSKEHLAGFENELEALRMNTLSKLGDKDEKHIKRIIRIQRFAEISGRGFLQFGIFPPFWIIGTSLLSLSKILDNMEIGHNVMHGQYDWMNDPTIHSSNFDWDTACDGKSWRQTHNYEHHTYTNIIGKDRDYGYGILRMDEDAPFRFEDYFNLLKFAMLSGFFQYGVGLHELEADRIIYGEIKLSEKKSVLIDFLKKTSRQIFKDYLFFPAVGMISGSGIAVLTGNLVANFVRNIWASSVIFCGHFAEGSHTFDEKDCEHESKGQWYYRQILGSCNFSGNKLMHIMSGHLSFQVEHHLFPDIPSSRYAEMSVSVQEICNKYNIPYNTAPMSKQYYSVLKKMYYNSFRPKQALQLSIK